MEISIKDRNVMDEQWYDYTASQHMKNLLTPMGAQLHIDNAVDFLKKSHYEYDSIAFTGMSGALLAPAIARAVGKNLIMVRKADDINNHAGRRVEGYQKTLRYIIVDDLVASGATARHIRDSIREFAPNAKCLGVLEASNYSGRPNLKLELNGLTRVLPDSDFKTSLCDA